MEAEVEKESIRRQRSFVRSFLEGIKCLNGSPGFQKLFGSLGGIGRVSMTSIYQLNKPVFYDPQNAFDKLSKVMPSSLPYSIGS